MLIDYRIDTTEIVLKPTQRINKIDSGCYKMKNANFEVSLTRNNTASLVPKGGHLCKSKEKSTNNQLFLQQKESRLTLQQ